MTKALHNAIALAVMIATVGCATAAEDETPAGEQAQAAPAQPQATDQPAESAPSVETGQAAGADQSAETGQPAGADKPAEPVKAEEPKTGQEAAPAAPEGTLKQTAWYLLAYERNKIGYMNRALYALDNDPSGAAYRIETRRFLRSNLAETRADFLEENMMWLDASFGALRFETTQRIAGKPELKISGKVDKGLVNVEAVCGDQKRQWSSPVRGNPTFGGALTLWLGTQQISEDGQWARTFVNERNGRPQNEEDRFRVIQKASLALEEGKRQPVWLISENNGAARTLHVIRSDGRLYRSQGQNHNQVVEEVSGADAAGLKLDGDVQWRNNVPLTVGDGLSCEVYGYKLALPSYPYATMVLADGGLVVVNNLLGDDTLIVVASNIRAGDEQAADRMYRLTSLFGVTGEPTRGETTIDGLKAQTYRVQSSLLGRDADCRFAVVIRDDIGYLLGHIAMWPAKSNDTDVFSRMISSVQWTRAFGREQGTWDGHRYKSLSQGYEVELPSKGWRLPQRRSGVATDIEAAREDGAAVVTVTVQQAQQGISPKLVAANYAKTVRYGMGEGVELSQSDCTLNDLPAVQISYDAKAIDDEPTQTRHVIAVRDNHWYLLTLVSKKSVLDSAGADFDRMLKSFKFGGDDESPATDN